MLLLFIISYYIPLTLGKHVADKEALQTPLQSKSIHVLVWPERYTVKAIKMILTSDLVEDMVAWKTNDASRVDYNGGAVKAITTLGANDYKYEIHPETNKQGSSYLVCHNVANALPKVSLDEILPPVKGFQFITVGNETVTDIETTKFESKGYSEIYDGMWILKITVWATSKVIRGKSIWIPVKFESTQFRHDIGSVESHEVWYYSDFNPEFNDSVFHITDDYKCLKKEMINHKSYSKRVTKELLSVNPGNEEHVEHIFNHFKTQFERKYADEKEHALRRNIFVDNMRLISITNRKNLTYKLGINQFADKTFEEVEREFTGRLKLPEGKVGNIPFPYSQEELAIMDKKLPKEHDLRLLGLVSAVKNQGRCGSCWALATTAVAEGALARTNQGKFMHLSTQALIDCAWGYGGKGCNGGWEHSAYDWMRKFGLPTVEDYGSYKNKDGFCHIANITRRYPIKGYTSVPYQSSNKTALKVAVVNFGPLSTSIHATRKFQFYSRGVFYDENCQSQSSSFNHVVSLVGYGMQEDSKKEHFWVLKNSHGIEWGEAGYMRISAKNNNCGVATKPYYVVF